MITVPSPEKMARRFSFVDSGVVPAAALFVVAVLLSVFPVASEDIWWHLRAGEFILKHRALPSPELLVYTTPPGTAWHDVQWLFQVIAASLYSLGSWNALIALRATLVGILALIAWFWLRDRQAGAVVSCATVCLTLLGIRYRIFDRPELFSYPLFAAMLWVLDRGSSRQTRFAPAAIAIQFAWANLHTSCVLGIAAGAAFAANQWILSHKPARTRKSPAKTARPFLETPFVLLGALVGVSLLNPVGWHMLTYGLAEGRRSYISEFQMTGPAFFLSASGVCILIAAVAWRELRKPNQYWLGCLTLFCLVLTVRVNRFYPYLGITVIPLVATGLEDIQKWVAPRISNRRVRSAILSAGLLLLLATAAAFTILTENKPPLRLGADDSNFPVGAADFVLRENIRGRLFNTFTPGGYLAWRLCPERKVFIFNETALNGRLLDRMVGLRTDGDWKRLFEEFDATYAIIPCDYTAATTTLGSLVHRWPQWKLVFWDDQAMVFVKDLPQYHELIGRRASSILPDLLPYRNNRRANLKMALPTSTTSTRWMAAGAELQRALEDSKRHFRAALALGAWHDTQTRATSASLTAYQQAEELDPESPELLSRMGQWYFANAQPDMGTTYLEKAIRFSASKADAMFNLALAQYKAGLFAEAEETLNRVTKIAPSHQGAPRLRSRVKQDATKKASDRERN